jgi:hypothetical protein
MEDLVKALYVYCTDFVINLANILNLSYYEVNAILFCFLYPLLIIGLTMLYFIQKRRLKNIKTEYADKG